VSPVVLDRNVATLDKTGFVETSAKRGHERRRFVGRSAIKNPDHRQHRLLRPHGERPSGCRAEKGDERAALHHEEFHARLAGESYLTKALL
jgi:hypothetical protein